MRAQGRAVDRPTGLDRFTGALIGLAVVAVAVRVAYVLGPGQQVALAGDSKHFYRPVADSLAAFEGYVRTTPAGVREVAASLPPSFPVVLAVLDVVGLGSVQAQQLAFAVLSPVSVVGVGLCGRRLFGGRAGLLAAAVTALDPLWITHSAALMSEEVVLLLVPWVLYLAVRCAESPTTRRFAGVGGLCGLLVLTRTDAAVVVPFLALAVAWASRLPWRRAGAGALVLVLATGLVVLPWSVRNRAQVGTWSPSLNGGTTVAGSNCPETYDAPAQLGSFDLTCSFRAAARTQTEAGRRLDPAALDSAMTRYGLREARSNRDRLPAVVGARLGRTWGAYPVEHQLDLAAREGRSPTWEERGLRLWWVLAVPFVAGVALTVLRRDRRHLILYAPIVQVTVVSAAVYGSSRMRVAAQPSIAILIGAGAAWALTALAALRTTAPAGTAVP